MVNLVLLWLLISPLALAEGWLALAGRGLQRIKYLGAALLIGLSGLLALLVVHLPQPPEPLCLFTHPSAGEMCVRVDASSLKLIALLNLMMAILIGSRMHTLAITPVQASFLFASLSAGNMALLSEHFLLRYIALELAAIWFLIELFLAFKGEESQIRQSISAFINLRVGDAGLLIAIFLMLSASGSFIIMRSLEGALGLRADHLAITISGLVLAVWVKLGIWPLNWWARIGGHLHATLFTWFCRLLIPVLGGYLLYRSAVLIAAAPDLANLIAILACLSALLSTLIRIFHSAYRDTILANQSFASCLLLGLAATGRGDQILPALISFLAARLLIDMLRHTEVEFNAQQKSIRTMWLLGARMLELILFIPLIFHIASGFNQGVWIWLLWMGLGVQMLLNAGKLDIFFMTKGKGKQPVKAVLQTSGMIGLAALGALTLHHLSRIWTDQDHSLWPMNIFNQSPQAYGMVLSSFLCAGILLWLVKYLQKSPALKALLHQTAETVEKMLPKHMQAVSRQDVLNQTPLLVRVYRKGMRFLGEREDIFDQYPRLIRMFSKMTRFLYERVEQFTSVDIWRKLQESVIHLARRLQEMHTGKLRLNLIWVVVVLVILVVLYLSGRLDVIYAHG